MHFTQIISARFGEWVFAGMTPRRRTRVAISPDVNTLSVGNYFERLRARIHYRYSISHNHLQNSKSVHISVYVTLYINVSSYWYKHLWSSELEQIQGKNFITFCWKSFEKFLRLYTFCSQFVVINSGLITFTSHYITWKVTTLPFVPYSLLVGTRAIWISDFLL